MTAVLQLSLTEGCRLDGAETLVTPRQTLSLAGRHPALAVAVRRLLTGTTEEELVAATAASAGAAGLDELYPFLFELHQRLLLRRSVVSGGETLLGAAPLTAACPFGVGVVEPAGCYVLSRFALLRRMGSRLVLESPRSPLRVTVHGRRGAALAAELVHPVDGPRLAAILTSLGCGSEAGRAAKLVLDLLGSAELLRPVDGEGRTDEERHPALRQWQFHDLLFHARSRWGRHAGDYGRTNRFRGRTPPPPALKPDMPGEVVELERPDLERLRHGDPPLTQVLEDRRSSRRHHEQPIDLRRLGEILYRSARVRETVGGELEVARRVYPGGGAAYELEVYLAVGRCRGLPSGLYHYRPAAHQLARLAGDSPEAARLLESAARAARMEDPVQVLVVLSARFRRLSWGYASIAYATVLKDVGVVMQTLYLTATAMGLAACAIGGGDSDLFARAAGTDYYEESSVGELVLGSRRQPSAEETGVGSRGIAGALRDAPPLV